MNQNQIVGEIKYRFASLFLNQLLEYNIITKEEWATFKKKLIKKYNPISYLEFNFKDGSVINIEL